MEKPAKNFKALFSFQLVLFNVITSKFKNTKELKSMSYR